jgi:predicted ATPase/DNA-binding SARP family transcriptional activator
MLGPLEIVADGHQLPLKAAKQKTILALLLLHPGEVVSVDLLKEALWEDSPPTTAGTALQGYVSQLRRMLESGVEGGAAILVTRAPGYSLTVTPDQVDVSRFEQLAASGREALAAGESDRAAALLAEALGLWRGPPLADFSYEGWAQAPIGRLEELRLSVLEDRIDADLASGRHAGIVGELESLIAEQPLRERLRGQLMLALYRGGRQADALEEYQAARRTLVEELGIEPGPELQQLNRLILNQDEVLAAPPRTTAIRAPIELPAPATPMIGRRDELAALRDLLAREDIRLITLTGPGGTGKTRLALEAAAEATDSYPDGVFWVSLASLSHYELVLPTVGQVLGAKDGLTTHIGEKQLLVVLDNLEHLIECGHELSSLLAGSPRLTLLVTSRESLRLSGEYEYSVPPLDQADAVALFVERARQHKPSFDPVEAVAEICSRLDGLPLALELAAARVKILRPEQILERLVKSLDLLTLGARDAPERQQTLRATIDWSYKLLTEDEKRVFAYVAVFAGSFDLEAGEEVAQASLDTLTALVDKGLLRQTDEGRFFMLATIREYAEGQLETIGDAEQLRRAHAEWITGLAEALEPRLRVTGDLDVLERQKAELENTRAALTWAQSRGEIEISLRLSGALVRYWWMRGGHVPEGIGWLSAALAQAGEQHPRLRATALAGFAALLSTDGRNEDGVVHATEAVRLARDINDQEILDDALNALGNLEVARGRFADAQKYFIETREISRRLEDKTRIGRGTFNLAQAVRRQGDPSEGRRLLEESLDLMRTTANNEGICACLLDLGDLLQEEGRDDESLERLRESIRISFKFEFRVRVFAALLLIAGIFFRLRSVREAAMLVGATERLVSDVSIVLEESEARAYEDILDNLRDTFPDDELTALLEEGRSMPLSQAVEVALGQI